MVKQFGTINSANNEKLGKVAGEVARNEQVSSPTSSDARPLKFYREKLEWSFIDSTQLLAKCEIRHLLWSLEGIGVDVVL